MCASPLATPVTKRPCLRSNERPLTRSPWWSNTPGGQSTKFATESCLATMLALIRLETILVIMVGLNLIGLTIAAYLVLRKK
jgi:hypothetical protein